MSQHVYLFYTEANLVEAQQVCNDLKSLHITCKQEVSTHDKIQQLLQDPKGVALLLISDNFLKDLTQARHLKILLELTPDRLVPVITHGRRPKKGNPERQEVYPTHVKTLNDVMYYRDYWYEAWISLRKSSKNVTGQELEYINEQKEIAKRLSVGSISNHIRRIKQLEAIDWDTFCADNYQVFLDRTGINPEENNPTENIVSPETEIPTINLPVEKEEDPVSVEEIKETIPVSPLTSIEEAPSTEETSIPVLETTLDKEIVEEEEKIGRIPVAEITQTEEEALFSLELTESLENLNAEEILARYDIQEVDNIDVLFHIAESQTEEDENEAARYTYERILTLDPYNGRALIWLARLLAKQENTEASTFYRKAIMVNDDNPNLYYEYGLLQKEEKSYYKASESFREALLLDEYYEDAYLGLAQCLKEMGRIEEAKANYLQACILDGERFETAENDNYFKVIRTRREDEKFQEELLEGTAPIVEQNSIRQAVVLVTGATSGIGRSIAGQFVLSGYKVIIAGRRTKRLEDFKKMLESQLQEAQVYCLTLDVRDLKAVKTAVEGLPEGWKDIDILINNAGLAKGLAPIHEGEIDNWETMIDTNLKGLLYVSRAVTPGMVARKKGHVINLGSVAGVQAYAGGGVYCATKAAVDSLTRSMRLDLYQHNIKVTAVHPGHVEETEFAKVRYEDLEKAKIYEDFKPLSAKDVADTVVYVATRPDHVNVQNILLFSTQQASATAVDRSGRKE